nr:hypothetical protein [uncultured Allomuricauda sp.]
MKYKKSQIGWVALLIFALVIILPYLVYANQWGNNPLPSTPFLVLVLIFVVICFMFYKLKVELSGSILKLTYGIGLIRIKLKIDELERTEIVKTPWYYGLGIRITPKGMLYNIQGSKAVSIEYTSNGKRKLVMVGSPEPERLKEALEEHWKK